MSIFNSSIASTLSKVAEWGQSTLKDARQAMKGLNSDAKYFSSTKKGEVSELRAELAANDLDQMKDAVKKVIAAVTVGKDMSPLFPDVVNCMRTGESTRQSQCGCCLASAAAALLHRVPRVPFAVLRPPFFSCLCLVSQTTSRSRSSSTST